MEWKGNKRVRKYIGVCLLFWMLFSLFMFLVARYEITKDWKRMITLMTEHPELEGEIIAAWEKGPDHPLFGDGVQERDALTARELRRALRLIEEKYGYDLNYTRSAGVLWGFW